MLKITSRFSGENTSVIGTITVDGVEHRLKCTGDASDRGTTGIVDDVEHWWCGAYDDNPKMEKLVEGIFEGAYNHVEEHGHDTEDDWDVEFDGEKFQNLVVTEPNDEEDDEDDEMLKTNLT